MAQDTSINISMFPDKCNVKVFYCLGDFFSSFLYHYILLYVFPLHHGHINVLIGP